VRNIVASPLTGVSGGLVDVRPLGAELDAGLRAEPRLAGLPTRFLFVLDDGRGDVSGMSFDLGYRAVDHDHGWLLLGGADLGIPVLAAHAARTMLDLAGEFLTASRRYGDVWHVRDLKSWTRSLTGVRTLTLRRKTTEVPLGAIADAASVSVPLALLTLAQVATVEACTAGRVVITPSRGLVLPGAADRLPELIAAGLIDDASSPWSAISACVGAPSCEKSLIDTRGYAMTLAKSAYPLPRTHISGCERRCGAPAGDHHDLVASAAAGPLLPVGEYQ
jgi:precorrin-3B synthase